MNQIIYSAGIGYINTLRINKEKTDTIITKKYTPAKMMGYNYDMLNKRDQMLVEYSLGSMMNTSMYSVVAYLTAFSNENSNETRDEKNQKEIINVLLNEPQCISSDIKEQMIKEGVYDADAEQDIENILDDHMYKNFRLFADIILPSITAKDARDGKTTNSEVNYNLSEKEFTVEITNDKN